MKLPVEYVTLRTVDIIIPDHRVLSLCLSANKLECESCRLFIGSIDSNLSFKKITSDQYTITSDVEEKHRFHPKQVCLVIYVCE